MAALLALTVSVWVGRVWVIGVLLPGAVISELSTVLGAEVSYVKAFTTCGSRVVLVLEDARVVPESSRKKAVLTHCRSIRIVFGWLPLVASMLHPSRLLSAAFSVVVIAPVVEWDGKGTSAMKQALVEVADGRPKMSSYVSFSEGTARILLKPGLLLEAQHVSGSLDLRDAPHIEGSLKFIHPSGAEISVNVMLAARLSMFSSQLDLNQLDLARFSRAMADLGVKWPGGLEGRLKARIECEGGYQTTEEFASRLKLKGLFELSGRRAAEVRRTIASELRREMNVTVQELPPAHVGGALRLKVDLNPPG